MSYEGHRQLWCEKGHHFKAPEPYDGGCPIKACSCGAKIAFSNPVDDTNGQAAGYIKPEELKPAVMCTCACCNNTHVKELAVYKIPHRRTQRFYNDGEQFDGKWVDNWIPLG